MCFNNNILYWVNITQLDKNWKTKVYCGRFKTPFKIRYKNIKKSFNHRMRKSDNDLSNEFPKIKDDSQSTNITWEILATHQAYNTFSKICSLCLKEKLKITLHRNNNMLNKWTEIWNKYRHRNKYILISYHSKD